MKLTLHKKTKKYILAILLFLLLFTAVQTYNTVKNQEIVTEEKVIFEYSCEQALDYSVNIRPNELYPGTVLEEGNYYSKLLLDNIQAHFTIDYESSDSTPIKIEYQVIARVNGYQGQAPEQTIYWSKDFPLIQNKIVEIEENSWTGEEQIRFTLGEYDAFAVRAKEISGMKVSNEVVVELFGTITAMTESEEVAIPLSSSLQIPLLEDVFQVTKNAGEAIQGSVKQTEETILPFDRTKVSLLAVLMLLNVAAIPVLMVVIKEPDELTIQRRKNNGLIRNYGSRLVAMKEIPAQEYRGLYQVHSIKDMIKIADEMQRPIFYIPDDTTLLRNNELFLISENTLYRWNSA